MRKFLCFLTLLTVLCPYVFSQQISVKGKVTDSEGASLPGVNILLKGTSTGTITDADGNYTINVVDENSILIFSYLGYLTEEITVGTQTVIDLTMVTDISELDEIVVIGYGTSLKKNVTTSIAKVDPDDVPKAANSNVNELLFGRASGVRVVQQSAQPGGQVDVSIRGRADFLNNGQGQPLYVVDGVVVPNTSLEPGINFSEINNVRRSSLAGLNPNDIESIEVLKDGSASIYGVEAANGVVIITTKKGKEGKMNVSYSGSRSYLQNMPYLEPLTAEETMVWYNRLEQDAYLAEMDMVPFGTNEPFDVPQTFSDEEIASAGEGTDWLGEIFRPGSTDNHNLSISGGTEKTTYYFSGNYFNQKGTVQNSDMQKFSGMMNLSFKFNKYLKLNTSLSASRLNFNNTVAGWQTGGAGTNGFTALQAALAYPRYVPIIDPETGEYSHFATTGNPVSQLDIRDKTSTNNILTNVSLDISFIPEVLTAKVLYGNNYENSNRDFFIPSTTNWFDDNRARGSLQYAKRQYQTFEGYISFDKELGKIVQTNIVAGYGEYIYDDNGYGIQAQDMLDAINTDNVAAGQATPGVNSYKNRNKKRSYFVRGTFDFVDRYIVTGSFRYDGYSQFFPESKYAAFPSVSLGWKISNEPFMEDVTAINLLKLRASIGKTGKTMPTGVAYAKYEPDADNVSFEDGALILVPYVLTQIDHPNLTWEKTINKDIGFDFALFNNRITGALDWFQDDVTDLLHYGNDAAPTAQLSAIFSEPVNGGHQVRTGIEAALNWDAVRKSNFTYSLALNLTHYKAKWKERYPQDFPSYQSNSDPIHGIYAFETNGILQLDQEVPVWQPDQAQIAGSPIFVDQDGNNTLDSADVVIFDQTPKLSIGFDNKFQFGNFDLSIFFYGQFGAYRRNYSLAWASPANFLPGNQNATVDIKDTWTTQNTGGTYPGAAYNEALFSTSVQGNVSGVGSDYDIMKADFVRCRNLTLGYSFNQPGVKKYFQQLRIYFDIQNLFIISKYKGADPEIMTPAVKGGAAPYPMVRTYTLGINANF